MNMKPCKKLVASLGLAVALLGAAATTGHADELEGGRRLVSDLQMYSNDTTNKTVVKLKYNSGEATQCGNSFVLKSASSPRYSDMLSLLVSARLSGTPVFLKWNTDTSECILYSISM